MSTTTSIANIRIPILEEKLKSVNAKIQKLEGIKYYTDQVAASFPMGMVGGSGRHVHSLNKRRERDLDKTIDNAVVLVRLYKVRDSLQREINDIKNNGPERRAEQARKKNEVLAKYWIGLKPGDSVALWTGNRVTIKKKNKSSIIDDSNIKWAAAEIIGAGAAALIKSL